MHRSKAGPPELMLQPYTCKWCQEKATVQFNSDGCRHPPNSVACIRCKKPVALMPANWEVRKPRSQENEDSIWGTQS